MSIFLNNYSIPMYVYVRVNVACVWVHFDARKGHQFPPELVLSVVVSCLMCVLGTKVGSF